MMKTARFEVDSAHLLHAGRVHADANWTVGTHAHGHWEFIYFVRGTGRIDTPLARLRPQAYHLVIYPPGLAHTEASSSVDPEQTVYFGVDVPGDPPPGAHLLLADPEGELGWLAERIVRETEKSGINPLAEAYTRAFLCLIEKMWDSATPVQHDIVDLATQYVFENYAGDITTQTLAENLHVSTSHLTHSFSAKLGISPLRYLQHVRVEAARRLLVTTQLPVSEIASRVGFSDPLYFSRVFKRVVGLSPTDYRLRANSAV